MQLIIVESPTKSKTIGKYLGPDYRVLSSYGHVRDLPKKELGIDIDHDFKPKYIIPTKAKKTISELKKGVQNADSVILATDPDREGEAIAWHLAEALGLNKKTSAKKISRVVFLFSPRASAKCQAMASPSRSGSVARITESAFWTPFFSSDIVFLALVGIIYLGLKS